MGTNVFEFKDRNGLVTGTYILNVGVFHFYLETVKFKVPFKGDLVVTPTWIP